MTTLLLDDIRTSTPPRTKLLTNNAVENLGGPLDRESAEPDGASVNINHRTGMSIQIANQVFRWHGSRIYRFGADVYYVPISTPSGSFLTFQAGDAWSTPSANGTFAEDAVAGDTFVKVRLLAGSITPTETITVNGGPADTATATADATEAQRGSLGQEGEWYVVHTLGSTIKAANTHTGLYAVNRGGYTGLAGFYKTSTNGLEGLRYDPLTDTWDETGATGVTTGSTASNAPGKTFAQGGSIYANLTGATISTQETAIYDAAANTVTKVTTATTGSAGGTTCLGRQMVDWGGRIFCLGTVGLSSAQDITLCELVGGAWQAVPGGYIDGASVATNIVALTTKQNGTVLIPFQNMLFALFYCQAGTGASFGWAVVKFTKDDVGNITADNLPGVSGSAVTLAESRKLAEYLLPAGLAFSTAGLANDDKARWFNYLDIEQNLPTGKPRFLLLHNSDPAGGVSDPYEWEIYDVLSLTLAWPGGAATSQVINVSGGTPSSEISVGDFVYLQSDQQIFEVTVVDDGGGTITIANPQARTIPTGSTESRKLRPFFFLTGAGALGEFAYPDDVVGGGCRTFVKGENDILIVGKLSELGGERLFYRVYGTGTVKVRLFHGPAINEHPQLASTMSTPSDGTIDGSGDNINVTADDGATLKNFKWEALADGVNNSLSRRRLLRVFA